MNFTHGLKGILCAGMLALAMVGCQSSSDKPKADKPEAKPAVKDARVAIRVNAGLEEDWKDSKGNIWKADFGYEGGGSMDRDYLEVVDGKDLARVYQTERYGMDSYSFKVENGKWLVKLHFSEDYDGNTDENSRVYAFAVKDGDAAKGKVVKEVKKFSPWKASGAFGKAFVQAVPVDVTSGMISITFFDIEADNSQINGIEIIPQ